MASNPRDSNIGSQIHVLDDGSTEQVWLNSLNTINFEESSDATTTRREQICYTAKDLDAKKKQPVVSRGAGSRVTDDLDSASSSKSHIFVTSGRTVNAGCSQVEIHLTEAESQWLNDESQTRKEFEASFSTQQSEISKALDIQKANIGSAPVKDSPIIIALKKEVACMHTELNKSRLREGDLQFRLDESLSNMREKGQENFLLREKLGFNNSSSGAQSTGLGPMDKDSNNNLRKNDAPRVLASEVCDLKQMVNILQDLQQRMTSLESQRVNEARGKRPDPSPLGSAVDYLEKRPATLGDPQPEPEYEDWVDSFQDQEDGTEQDGDRILDHEESDG